MLSLFALGSNGSGQLGIGHEDDVDQPTAVSWHDGTSPAANIRLIAAGGNHSLVLLEDGQVFYAGNNNDGRCLDQEVRQTSRLRRVVLHDSLQDQKIRLCACMWEASIALLQDGRVIASGTGHRGELGLGSGVTGAPIPRLLKEFPPAGTTIIDLTASMNHCLVVLSNGDVYGWGAGRKGQLGPVMQDSWVPRKLDCIAFRAKRAVAGTNFSYIIGGSQGCESVFLGADKWSLRSAVSSPLPPWTDIEASWGSIFVLSSTGKVLSWGRNDHLQLSPKDLPSAMALAAGSEHAVILTADKAIIAWGWGEHGNCGSLRDSAQPDSTSTQLPFGMKPTFVGAGCATTWIASFESSPQSGNLL